MAAVTGAGASAPVPLCADPECNASRWSTTKRGRVIVHSELCFEHSNLPLLDVPTGPKPKPAKRSNPAAVFRKEVERQRLEQERRG
jgi:hypothetical protein